MKHPGIMLNTLTSDSLLSFNHSEIGDDHIATSTETPMRKDAFEMSDHDKKIKIAAHFQEIMHILGLDLTDDSLKGTPKRVAKMYVEEIFSGLNPLNKPKNTLFENKYKYNSLLLEKDITFFSNCEHHFVPIMGKAHVAYISSGKVIGLSKLNRTVQYFSKRPQVQERLTMQIGNELMELLNTKDVAVILEAKHMCVCSRGVQDNSSLTTSMFTSGEFEKPEKLNQLLSLIGSKTMVY
jgi:GTP cyclohydrolase IA